MGHLFEKRKICHGYQGNYHSERKGGWGGRLQEKRKKKVPQLLWAELDFGGILSLQDKQQRGLFSSSSLLMSSSLSVSLSSLIPLTSSPTDCLAHSLSAVFLLRPLYSLLCPCFPSFPLIFSSRCSIIRNNSVKAASN